MNRQAWRDFLITLFFLGLAFVIALMSSIAAERHEGRLAAVAAGISLLLALLGALYIIPRLARNVRLEMMRFAVRTTVTVEGLFFILFLVVIAFAAWNTGNNLLYLILSAMLAFLVAANVLARMSLADVSVQLRFPDHIFAGEPARLTITLVNHKRLTPSFSLMVEPLSESSREGGDGLHKRAGANTQQRPGAAAAASVAEGDESEKAPPQQANPLADDELGKLAYFMLTPARASARQRVEYTFNRRGRYPITGFRISTKFPAGFFKKWRRIDAAGEILVYPKPRPLDDFYHGLPMLVGQVQSQARGSGDDLYAIRRYHPSDHMRHIDWKATAKSMEMMVREHMREDEWRLTIVFDTKRPETPEPVNAGDLADQHLRAKAGEKSRGDSRAKQGNVSAADSGPKEPDDSFEAKFERAIVMAASLANHFILERAEVELVTPDESQNVSSGSGYDHLYKILKSLSVLQPTADKQEIMGDAKKGATARRTLFRRPRRALDTEEKGGQNNTRAKRASGKVAWRLLEEVPVLADERRFKVLITSAAKGTIPASVWRSAHVVFMEDL